MDNIAVQNFEVINKEIKAVDLSLEKKIEHLEEHHIFINRLFSEANVHYRKIKHNLGK